MLCSEATSEHGSFWERSLVQMSAGRAAKNSLPDHGVDCDTSDGSSQVCLPHLTACNCMLRETGRFSRDVIGFHTGSVVN